VEGYRVLTALTLEGARKHLEEESPDLILLDVMLPDGDGMDFCREIAETVDSHILFLTGKGRQEDRLRGLEYGGDDYITKPYVPDELLLRIKSAMRRRRKMVSKVPRRLLLGALELDIAANQAFLNGEDILLTQKEFALLLLFAQNENKTMGADELYEMVWRRPMNDDNSAVKNAVSRLRKKLAGSAYSIESSRRSGYCFKRRRS
jgi:DNA-binding response OmpR family regulator